MFKFVVLAMVIAAANAGVIGLGHGAVVAAPAVAVAHGATSYQNSNSISLHPTPVVAPVLAHAPVAVAHAAPIALGHAAPVSLGLGLGHGLLH